MVESLAYNSLKAASWLDAVDQVVGVEASGIYSILVAKRSIISPPSLPQGVSTPSSWEGMQSFRGSSLCLIQRQRLWTSYIRGFSLFPGLLVLYM